MRADRHHSAPRCAFFQQLLKIKLDLFEKMPRCEINDFSEQNVVIAQRVRNDNKVFSLHFFDEELIAADIIYEL